ncbi:putative bifunctional UDP-N-acetylglucosamine transferase and deubiquitinase ALG13 isoform X1 [Polypterus senegalus]|uniref:putative bifunctional UDP-N-acetylglucosamine transferase and deubiquitinase ALG13 isoform X1 n=1 Tax=Polypterus senegalus TaxID=55291 RepID=UPI0019649592|nr:putative bifunctional UDP-N-acetylglucosamine transferase and deubiquitinase ALG13 isoform X1 [Polypterus senegalus]
MQKSWKKYFLQKPPSEVTMDEYLASLGLYRKITARDASCLFRAVSEQLYYSQNYYERIRKACVMFMRANRCNFEPFVEGSFEKYLERLQDPTETAGQVEIKALSLLYKRCFVIYRHPGKPPTEISEKDFKEKILLCCSNNGHYDCVYPKQYPIDAAVCQALLYEILYKDVFGIEEEEIIYALEAFHTGGRRYRNSMSVGSEDASFDACEEKNQKSFTENCKEDNEKCHFEASEEMSKVEDLKITDGPSKIYFPYKVLKSLDPDIYRNIEFDVWHDSRKELQKTDYMVFAGRQYCLGDKCQVRLEPGGKYYNAFIQEVGPHTSAVTVFIEELGEKHLVPLTNLKPVTQVNPVPAWSNAPRKSGSYTRMAEGYVAEIDVDHEIRGRKRFYKKARGKEMFMAVAYTRGQSGLPPRLQHSIPSARFSQIHSPSGNSTLAEQYRSHPSSHRSGRGYGPSRHHLIGPDVAYYNSGKRCYQSFDNFSYRTRSYSRSRRQMHCVNKECQFTFVPENGEESQGMEGTITFYEIEEGDETAFPPLPGQAVSSPVVPAPATYWVRRGHSPLHPSKQTVTSSEEDIDDRSNNGEFSEDYIYADAGYQSPAVFAAAESTSSLSLQETTPPTETPPDGVAAFSYSQQVMVSSTVISPASCAHTTPITVFSSCSGGAQNSVSSLPPQSVAQPTPVPSPPLERQVVLTSPSMLYPPAALLFVNEMGEPVNTPPPPPYSCDPNGNDLPRDGKILQYYFNLGVQWHHQSYWNSIMQMQQIYQQPPVDHYQTYNAIPTIPDQPLQQQYSDAGRMNNDRVTTEALQNGTITSAESTAAPQGTIYYPVVTEQFNQQLLPTYEPCFSMVPAYHYVSPWPPINQPRIHGTICPSTGHQVNYITTPAPVHYVP